jgi:hypothetical protein
MAKSRTLKEYKHEPSPRTRAVITNLLRMGAPQKTIAKIMCMSCTTLHEHYKDLLDTIHAEKSIDLLDTAFYKAIHEGNVQMLIYLLNTVVGLQDKEAEETNNFEAIGKITMEILSPKQKPTEELKDE